MNDIRLDFIRALYDKRLDIIEDIVSSVGNSIIHTGDDWAIVWASGFGNLDMVKYLVFLGADIRARNDNAVGHAARYGNLEIIKYLVSLGADIRANNDESIIYASRNGHLNTVRYLVSLGADIRANNDEAIVKASKHDHFEVVRYLCSLGANKHRIESYYKKQLRTITVFEKILAKRRWSVIYKWLKYRSVISHIPFLPKIGVKYLEAREKFIKQSS